MNVARLWLQLRRCLTRSALILVVASSSQASQGAAGDFLIKQSCPAYQSFRKATNPGSLTLRPGERYAIVEVNKAEDIGWVRVRAGGGELRWVAVECGTPFDLRLGGKTKPAEAESCDRPEEYDSFVLALTWQPGFCEHFHYQGKKPECQAMAEGRLNISHLTLHGLWPNKSACGKTYGRCPGTDIDLTAETLAYIRPWMPNFYYETTFGSYQWKKHGLCQQQLDDDGYFRRAVDYVKLVNDSALGAYITANIGGSIDKNKFYRLVSEILGESTRRQVQLICAGQHLQEVRIRLPRDLRPAATLKELLGDGETEAMASDGAECRGDSIAIEKSGP